MEDVDSHSPAKTWKKLRQLFKQWFCWRVNVSLFVFVELRNRYRMYHLSSGPDEEFEMKSGVYKIEHSKSGKVYIGSALNLPTRKVQHKRHLRKGTHHNTKLQRAWNKYGEEAFEFSTILICAPEHLLDYEQRCIDGFDSVKSGYNISPKAGSTLGIVHTPESRSNMSRAHKGKNLGRPTPESTRSLISSSLKGRKHSAEAIEKMTEAAIGRGKGKPLTAEHKAKISAARTGHKHSEESIALMSRVRQGTTTTSEHKEKISEGLKRYYARSRNV